MFVQTLKVIIEYCFVVMLVSISRAVIYQVLDITMPLITHKYSKFCVIASSYSKNFRAVDLVILFFAIDLIVLSKIKSVKLDQSEKFFTSSSYMSTISNQLGITIGFVFCIILALHFLASIIFVMNSKDLLFKEIRQKYFLYMSPIRNLSDNEYYNRVKDTSLRKIRNKDDLSSLFILVLTLFVYFGQMK